MIYEQLGAAEVDDQLVGIRWLKSQPWIDGKRIGVFGWSYGGFMTTMMLAKASDELAGGVAVAPVTNWRLYDTFYTERYLGRPQDNDAGYTRSSPMAWLDGLTSKLYLVHGMADRNAVFAGQFDQRLNARITAFFWHAVLPQFEVITLAHLQGQTSRYSQTEGWW